MSEVGPSGTTEYQYNSRNRIAGVTRNGQVSSYVYNTEGIRIQKTDSGVTTDYTVDNTWSDPPVVLETTGQNNVAYTYGLNRIRQTRGGQVHHYHHDALGSTRALSGPDGHISDTWDYTAFGEERHRSGDTDNHFLFTGEAFDASLDHYYLRARYYNPAVGRFPTMDTYRGRNHEPATLHKYLYTHGDPVNMVDPSGHMSLARASAGLTIITTLSNIAITSYSMQKMEGEPSGASISISGSVSARGIGGAIGAHIYYDFISEDIWLFAGAGLELSPTSVFRGGKSYSVFAGPVWNTENIEGGFGISKGATATWPIGAGGAIAKAFRRCNTAGNSFWSFMCETGELAGSRKGMGLQFGFMGTDSDSPAFARIGSIGFSMGGLGYGGGVKVVGEDNIFDSLNRRLIEQAKQMKNAAEWDSLRRRMMWKLSQ